MNISCRILDPGQNLVVLSTDFTFLVYLEVFKHCTRNIKWILMILCPFSSNINRKWILMILCPFSSNIKWILMILCPFSSLRICPDSLPSDTELKYRGTMMSSRQNAALFSTDFTPWISIWTFWSFQSRKLRQYWCFCVHFDIFELENCKKHWKMWNVPVENQQLGVDIQDLFTV